MKTKFQLILILSAGLTACTFEGVKDSSTQINDKDTLHNKLSKVDSAFINMEDNLVEEIKPDTLESGKQNEMVWMSPEGIRIEWRRKKTTENISTDNVILVNYEARVARGEIYDSNTEIGHPVPLKLGVGQLVKGWELALLQMHAGDMGRIMIPSSMAYGEHGYLGKVPQNADIIVEIEIVKKITPVKLDEGVRVYIYEYGDTANALPEKNQEITFDYFAYRKGKTAGIYDNSYAKGAPFTVKFKNDNVVDGLHQGLEILRQGDKAYIDIPSQLAYGKKGMLDLVPSNTDIVYDIRIQEIK